MIAIAYSHLPLTPIHKYIHTYIHTQEEYHLDLLCWIIKGCQILVRLTKATGQPKVSQHYQNIAEELLVSIVERQKEYSSRAPSARQ